MVRMTEADIARARTDSVFKQRLLTSKLELLLAELGRQQKASHHDPSRAPRIREASELAARLADIIRELDDQHRAARERATGEPN